MSCIALNLLRVLASNSSVRDWRVSNVERKKERNSRVKIMLLSKGLLSNDQVARAK